MSTQKRRQNKKQSGGDAYHHAIDTYGGIGQQVAQAGSNVIASHPVGAAPVGPVTGGSRKSRRHHKKSKRHQRKSMKNKSRRHRR